jgi:predicted cupin superfamily sugar epimerase
MNDPLTMPPAVAAAALIIERLGLKPHPEGGWYRERFRSARQVQPDDGRPARSALTTIDFLLEAGQFSAWHRVRSDEAWHLLEGGPLRLWTWAPGSHRVEGTVLAAGAQRCQVVEADAWQAAEPLGGFALCGATVGPGFDFADFAFGRDHPELLDALARLAPELRRLL